MADVTVTPVPLTAEAALLAPTILTGAWLEIDSSNIDSYCGDDGGTYTLAHALDGTGLWWQHTAYEIHDFVLDLGQSFDVQMVKGRSNVSEWDPIDVDIYVSNDKESWGAAVASGINTWQDIQTWVEIPVTHKVGRYVKVVINGTEDATPGRLGFGQSVMTIFDVFGKATAIVTPAFLAAEATLFAPTIIAEVNVTVTPELLAAGATLLAPTITTTRSVTVTPSPLAAEATLLAPTIVVPGVANVTVYPEPLAAKVTLLAPYLVIPYTDIPPFMHKDMIDPYSGGAWLWLAQIIVPGLSSGAVPTRIARNTEDVHYGEDDFDKFNFQIGEQAFSGDGSIPRVTLRIFQDINRRIEDLINETEGALGAEVKLIRVNEKFLDTPVAALEYNYDNLASESDSEWVTFTLGIPNPLTQSFPLRMYSSNMCPWPHPETFKGPRCQYTGGDTTCTGTYEDCYTKGNAVHWGAELGLDPSVVKEDE